jgi:uncharacterized membrane protein YraQ (UPF0718 family)
MAILLFLLAYRMGNGLHWQGMKAAAGMLKSMLPILLIAYILTGFVEVLTPVQLVRDWLGAEAGWKGIFLGSAAGALLPGGPFMVFPLIAAVYKMGAGLGTMVALISGWSMWGLILFSFEIPIMGIGFSVVRMSSSLIFPPLAGFLAQYLFAGGF